MILNQFGTKISILRSDNGTEYINTILGDFLNKHGILHQSTCSDSPEQNGIAERKNKHLLEVARAMMFHTNIPKYLWGDAILTASYLINRMPTKVLNYSTPLECLKRFFPDSRINSDLPQKIFGCTAYVHLPKRARSKLEPRADKCVFIGYGPNKKGYKCFNPSTRRYYVTMDVSFLESNPYFGKNLIQGEKLEELNLLTNEPLPISILDTHRVLRETGESTTLPSHIGITGKEILQNKRNEYVHVYSRRKYSDKGKDQTITSFDQSADSGTDLPSKSSTSLSSPTSLLPLLHAQNRHFLPISRPPINLHCLKSPYQTQILTSLLIPNIPLPSTSPTTDFQPTIEPHHQYF